MPAGIEQLEPILLLLLVFVVGLAALAKRLEIPYPIVLVVGGLVVQTGEMPDRSDRGDS